MSEARPAVSSEPSEPADADRPGDRSGSTLRRAAYHLPVAVSLALGLVGTARVHLWRDEFATLGFSSLPAGDLARATGHVDAVLAPYYFLMRGLVVLGVHGTGLRVPSVLAAAAGVAVVLHLARRWWGPAAGFVSAAALAVNPLYVQLSTDARPYALATLATLLAALFLDRAVDAVPGGGRGWWIAYSVAIAVAGVLHLFAVLVVLAHAMLVLGRRRATLTRFGAALVPAAVVVCALAVLAHSQRGQVAWIQPPGVVRAAGVLLNVADYQRDGDAGPGAVVAALAVVAAVVVVLSGMFRRRRDGRGDGGGDGGEAWNRAGFAVVLAAGPWAVLLVASLVAFPVLTSHYLAASTPGSALLFGAATGMLTVHRPRWWRPGLAAMVVALLAATAVAAVPMVIRPAWQDDFPALAEDMDASLRPGGVLVIVQKFEENGFAAGVAHYAGDRQLAADVQGRLPAGSQPVLDVRRVLGVAPVRTVELTGRARPASVWIVSVRGSRLPDASDSSDGAGGAGGARGAGSIEAALAQLGCRADAPLLAQRDHGSDRIRQVGCGASGAR